jgi:hypothetical protein
MKVGLYEKAGWSCCNNAVDFGAGQKPVQPNVFGQAARLWNRAATTFDQLPVVPTV